MKNCKKERNKKANYKKMRNKIEKS